MRPIRLLLVIALVSFFLLFFTACNRGSRVITVDPDIAEPQEQSENFVEQGIPEANIEWTLAEIDRIKELRGEGLNIATTESDAIWELDESGNNIGLQYLLVQNFADFIDVEMDVYLVDFIDYFTRDGIVPDEVRRDREFSYTPDLLESGIDIYVDTITVLPWREQILSLIPIFPTRLVVLSRIGSDINSIEELENARISIIPDTASEDILHQIEDERGVEFQIIFVDDVYDEARYVAQGLSDATVQDANVAILHLQQWSNLGINFSASDIQQLSWAVSPEDPALASVINKYLEYAQSRGFFDQLWSDYYGITLIDYIDLILD